MERSEFVQITAKLPADDVEALRERAVSEYRTFSAELRRLVSLSLDDARREDFAVQTGRHE